MMFETKPAILRKYPLDHPYVYGVPLGRAKFRTHAEDFYVNELMEIEPSGDGEHIWLHIEKNGQNTAWVAKALAEFAGVQEMDVGFAGQKDRWAVTRQWFSIYYPKGEPLNWRKFTLEGAEILQVARHKSKLRRGDHVGNEFRIVLRSPSALKISLENRLSIIADQGVPNYYGPQRFGRGGHNLELADVLFLENRTIRNRQKRSMALSAARSWLFNHIVAQYVAQGRWLEVAGGDTQTGPLWGRGRAKVNEGLARWEYQCLIPYSEWLDGLEHKGLNQERRPLCVKPKDMQWQWLDDQALVISFSLQKGDFATTVLRELTLLDEPTLDERYGNVAT